MSVAAALDQCCECGEQTDNRSLICDGCASLYPDEKNAPKPEAGE